MIDKSLTILVVEDEPIIRMDLALGLADLGYTVLEARDAATALRVMDGSNAVDVLVTDIDMPGEMNGLTLSSEARQRSDSCRIVIMSGGTPPSPHAIPQDSPFLAKPLAAKDIVAALVRMP
ncbi:Response regulator receiver domain-containing protein [Salipiger thiooxidans]|uniref:Response regulator receiver domain-containing protein n=1 Tax=Salipiger thiooxidans TaxID=282683 RepID=A0A1G7MVL1_9RHOB|nr:response regulator [Salipiger thiooxidans]SDF65772.1 Response regulator receiver domain-containing protein [Salipiger thiooxidans]